MDSWLAALTTGRPRTVLLVEFPAPGQLRYSMTLLPFSSLNSMSEYLPLGPPLHQRPFRVGNQIDMRALETRRARLQDPQVCIRVNYSGS